MLTNGVRFCDAQCPCENKLLTLQIITVAAAVVTTAAYADAFVIRVVAIANVFVHTGEQNGVVDKNISDAYKKNQQQKYKNSNYNYLRVYTKLIKINNARNCCCNELISKIKQNKNLNADKCEKKNNLESYKCVVYKKQNENIIYSTKALTQNNENTDFINTRFCEIVNNNNNVNRMIKILENSKTFTLEHPNNDDVNESFSQKGKYNQTLISHVAALRSLAFLTFLRFPLCWLSTLLFNMRTFAIKVLCNQQSLYRTSGNGNICPSVRIPLLSSLLWSQLLSQKSWPSASSVAATTPPLVASVYAKSTSQTIYAMYSRCNAFTMSYVMYATFMLFLLPTVHCDNGDDFFLVNAFSISPETTTPEFDYAGRGQKKFGDKCENTLECGFPGSICDAKKKSCQCTEDLPVTNHFDKCGKEAAVNESCFFNEQCEVKHYQTECRDGRCTCRYEMQPFWGKDGTVECKGRGDKRGPETYIDPAMIGVLVGMALMFVIICVVLRLFSQARWRENRTIFNTPNPRLMNVSLLRDSKLLHGQERRGSRMSVRAPSRQPSMASLRPHSPNPSLGKTGRMTRSKSNTRSSDSRVSDVSNCSRLLEHSHTNTHAPHTFAPYTTTTHNTNVQSSSPHALTSHTNATANGNGSSDTDVETAMCLRTPPPVDMISSNKF